MLGFADPIDDEAAGDREGPRKDLGVWREVAPRAVHLQERLLQQIGRQVGVGRPPEEKSVQAGRESVVKRGERGVVAPGVAVHCLVRDELPTVVATSRRWDQHNSRLPPELLGQRKRAFYSPFPKL